MKALTAQFNEPDRPPAGTPCAACKESGHFNIANEQEVIDTLRGWHPASIGYGQDELKPSVYDSALKRARDELCILGLEIDRMQSRRKALAAILQALEANIELKRSTR